MAIPEIRNIYERPRGLEEWLAQIEFQWRDIPKLEFDPRKFRHLGIVCDGNRRAASKKGLEPYFGHQAGIETIKGIARACREWGIHTLTFWLWSTENWEREKEQVEFIMRLGREYLKEDKEFIEELHLNQVRFTHLGRKDRIPPEMRENLEEVERQTVGFDQYRLNFAIDYGGLDEMARAIGEMFRAFHEGRFNPETLKETPQAILDFLDTVGCVLPELVIRTGVKKGELPHTSGFMPLQTAYACWVFSPVLFPDFTPKELLKNIKSFLQYERRLGR